MNKKIGIYQLRNIVTQDIYIGGSIDVGGRKRQHFSYLNLAMHPNKRLQDSFNKYGKHNFVFEILELIVYKRNVIKREQFYLDTLKPYFNIAKIAGTTLGITLSEETRKKISIANIGKKFSEEHKRKIKESSIRVRIGKVSPFKGVKLSEDRIAKMRERIGEKNSMYGKKHSIESRKK